MASCADNKLVLELRVVAPTSEQSLQTNFLNHFAQHGYIVQQPFAYLGRDLYEVIRKS